MTGVLTMEQIIEMLMDSSLGLPLVSSLVTGMLIGLERELQGKSAGLRTHALVCFAAAILTLAAARQGEWTVGMLADTQIVSDPTRMAHGILTGIGFLGAGVIFKEGASVQGLTTAASLWITTALGIVYGVGMYVLAVAGTIVTLVVLIVLRVIYHFIPRRVELRVRVAVAANSSFGLEDLEHLLRRSGLKSKPLDQSFDSGEQAVEYTSIAYGKDAWDRRALLAQLCSQPSVMRFHIHPVDSPEIG
jgi:putative Mg2+ transporter-C (MgtC) family protein